MSMMTPSSDEVQALASRWAATLSAASRNLIDFAASEICLMVKARLRPDHPKAYKGATLAKGSAARSELDALLQDYLPLAHVVESAQELANKSGRLFNHDKEVLQLLTGPSVLMIQPEAPVHGSRNLLQGASADNYCTPNEALASMQERFARAHDDFVAIFEAQNTFQDQLASLEKDRDELTARAAGFDFSIERFSIDESDPLSSLSSIGEARATLRQAAQTIQSQMDERAKCEAELARAASDIMAVRSLCARNSMVIDEVRERIFEQQPPQPCATQDALMFLENWHAKLSSTAQAGRHAACWVGAAKLRGAIADQSAASSRAYAINRNPLDELADLKGRFEAFSAKTKALSAMGAPIPPTLAELQWACGSALSAKPAKLTSVRKLVGAFEAAVSALGS